MTFLYDTAANLILANIEVKFSWGLIYFILLHNYRKSIGIFRDPHKLTISEHIYNVNIMWEIAGSTRLSRVFTVLFTNSHCIKTLQSIWRKFFKIRPDSKEISPQTFFNNAAHGISWKWPIHRWESIFFKLCAAFEWKSFSRCRSIPHYFEHFHMNRLNEPFHLADFLTPPII